ncbi:MAG: Holliday junction resolvase RuvX [Acidimicrobiia bacterium]
MGLDYGTRRVGVAISDPLRILAQPHGVIDQEHQELEGELRRLVEEMEVDLVVVGLPISLSGREGPAARAARAFARRVAEVTGLPVELADERLSTVAAEGALREGRVRGPARRRMVDRVAAALMLQSYLDRTSLGFHPPLGEGQGGGN